MKNEYEIISHSKIKHINVLLNKITYRNFHMHTDLELVYVLGGNGKIRTQKKEYSISSGSFFLFNFNEPHEIDAHEDSVTVIVFQISKHFLNTYFPDFKNTCFLDNNISAVIENEEEIDALRLICGIAKNYMCADKSFELRCVSNIALLLSLIYEKTPYQILSDKEYIKNMKFNNRVDRIFSYIDDNYQLPIRLSDVAEMENITTTHLSHFFTENFGISFQEYLNNVRFEHAVRIIGDKSMSISEIAALSGFSELKYMNNIFEKKLGVKPKEFRQQQRLFEEKDNNKYIRLLEHKFSDAESLDILNSIC